MPLPKPVPFAIAWLLVAATASACGSTVTQSAAFRSSGVHVQLASTVVSFADPAVRRVVDGDWRLDNFEANSSGLPGRQKTGPNYETRLSLDADGNGTPEHVETVAAFDLKFVHPKTGGQMWVRHVPMSPAAAALEMHVLLRDYLASIEATGAVTVHAAKTKVGTRLTFTPQRQLRTRMVTRQNATLDQRDAIIATFALDEVIAGPDTLRPWRSARILMVRTGEWVVKSGHRWPVVLLAALVEHPETFAKAEPAFDALVRRLHFVDFETKQRLVVRDLIDCRTSHEAATKVEFKFDDNNSGVLRLKKRLDDELACMRAVLAGTRFPDNAAAREMTLDI